MSAVNRQTTIPFITCGSADVVARGGRGEDRTSHGIPEAFPLARYVNDGDHRVRVVSVIGFVQIE